MKGKGLTMSMRAMKVITITLAIFVLFLINVCYAQSEPHSRFIAPEPSSLAIISTGGLFGYIVRFARRHFRRFKRYFDVAASAVGLVLTFPILAFAALLIKIVSPGPVFFKQPRVGFKGKVFDIYKLRTMKIDAEKNTGPVWAKEDDPRLIKFGGVIRKMHIDELPQLINVFRGQMSMIGPRPERPAFVKYLTKEIGDYKKRLTVKPGITGLAQVWHKYDETIGDVKRKIKYDLLYIRKMCVTVDMRILALTLVAVLTGKGAR